MSQEQTTAAQSSPFEFNAISLVQVSSDEGDDPLRDPSISPAEQIVSILTVPQQVDHRLLDCHPDVKDVVTAYSMLSDEQKETVEALSTAETFLHVAPQRSCLPHDVVVQRRTAPPAVTKLIHLARRNLDEVAFVRCLVDAAFSDRCLM